MHLNITARHFKASAELKEFTNKQVSRLERYYDGIIEGDVILSWEKHDRIAEIVLAVQGQRLAAKERSEEMHKSISSAVDKIERQVKKYKEKWQKKGNAKAGSVNSASDTAQAI